MRVRSWKKHPDTIREMLRMRTGTQRDRGASAQKKPVIDLMDAYRKRQNWFISLDVLLKWLVHLGKSLPFGYGWKHYVF